MAKLTGESAGFGMTGIQTLSTTKRLASSKKSMNKIAEFTGRYRFLSNFWSCTILLGEEVYPSVEHAYQASKTLSFEERKRIREAKTPSEARRLGRIVTLRMDWKFIRLDVMELLLRRKFFDNLDLKQKLLSTGDSNLVKGNYWGDTFWGVCNEKGENHLGKLLMKIREELRNV